MKTARRIPCLPGWLAAIALGLLGLLPDYGYIQVAFWIAAGVVTGYCIYGCLKPRKPRIARVFGAVLTGVVILGVCVGCFTGGAIVLTGARTPEKGLPYILVLGAKVDDGGASACLQERIDTAFAYLTENPDTVAVVSGGKGEDEPISEAECMYAALTERGIAPERIWMEDQATSTWENLKLSLAVIEEKTGSRPQRVGVVSNEFHLFRVGLQAKAWGLELAEIPAKTQAADRYLHYFIREIAGVWHYIILGGEQ